MSARDDLVKYAIDWLMPGKTAPQFADDLLAAGWRPPRRIITTLDELKTITLPAAIRTKNDDTLFRSADGDEPDRRWWFLPGAEMDMKIYENDFPATVLFEGES